MKYGGTGCFLSAVKDRFNSCLSATVTGSLLGACCAKMLNGSARKSDNTKIGRRTETLVSTRECREKHGQPIINRAARFS